VDNLADYFGQFAPQLLTTRYGDEIWALYESARCTRIANSPATSREPPAT
jgi:hypothetical protein